LQKSAVSRQIIELYQFCDHLVSLPIRKTFWHTHLQVTFDKPRFKLLYLLSHCVRLMQDIHAANIILDHATNAAKVFLIGKM